MTGSRSKLVSAVVIWAALVASPSASAAGRCGDPAARPWCDTTLPAPIARRPAARPLTARREDRRSSAGDDLAGVARRRGHPHRDQRRGPAARATDDLLLRRARGAALRARRPRCRRRSRSARPSIAGSRPAHAAVIADEVIHKGNDVVFAPTVDIVRTPLAGRVFEAIGGEDPVPLGRARGALDRDRAGARADRERQALRRQQPGGHRPARRPGAPGHVPCSPRHPRRPIGNRMAINARIDERTMRELYLPMFEAAVKRAERRLGDVRLQQGQRAVRLPEPGAA